MTDSTAETQHARGDQLDRRLELGGEPTIGARTRARPAAELERGACRHAGLERRAQLDRPRGGHQLDREHPGEVRDDDPKLARRRPAHRHMIFLHRRRRDRRDARRRGETAVLVDQRRRRVLGDHQTRVDTRLVGEERGQAVRARGVEQPVDASLGHRPEVGEHDREEVRSVGQGCAVEVAVRGDPAVRRARPGCRSPKRARAARRPRRTRARLAPRRAPGVHTATSTRPAPVSRHAVLTRRSASRRAPSQVRGADAWPGWGRSARISGANTASVPSSASTLIAAVMSATTRRVADVVARERQHPEHAVGAVDERQAFLRLEDHRLDARWLERHRSVDAVAAVDTSPSPRRTSATVRERREIAAAAERAVLGDA